MPQEIKVDRFPSDWVGSDIKIDGELFRVIKQEGNTLTIRPRNFWERVKLRLSIEKWKFLERWHELTDKES